VKLFPNKIVLHQIIRLAVPLVLTQVGHIVVGIVDTIFLGYIGKTEQAAGILANNLYVLLLVFAIGVSYAVTPFVTAAKEKEDTKEQANLFKNSLWLNGIIGTVLFVLLFFGSDALAYMQQPQDVVNLSIPFYQVLIFSIIPVSLFFTCKQYSEGIGNTMAALYISVIGNIINIILNYMLIYGKMGLPVLGYMGSAYASLIARTFMGVAFLVLVFKSSELNAIKPFFKHVKLSLQTMMRLAKIGINAGLQFTFEVAAFAIAGLMAGKIGTESIDAHGIALSLAAFTYMFGSGLSGVGTMLTGKYLAQKNYSELREAVSALLKLVVLIMGFFGLLFLSLHRVLPQFFTNHADIISLASDLLIIAALFQLFDGIQVLAIGILRGFEESTFPTIITLVGYWLIALPVAYYLAFYRHWNTVGIWIGLLLSLVFVALSLLWRVRYRLRTLTTQS
jgi:multidrug resistance protein, MATE family